MRSLRLLTVVLAVVVLASPVLATPDPVQLSPAGAQLVASFEGFSSTVYNDPGPGRHCTIGFGHLIHLGPCSSSDRSRWGSISRERGLELLQADADDAETALTRLVRVRLNINQGDALVSWVFNVGTGALAQSTLLRELNAGHYNAVPNELRRWVKAGGMTLPGLVRRRDAEAQLFMAAVPKSPKKLTRGQARHIQTAENAGTDITALRGIIAYFQNQIDRTKQAAEKHPGAKDIYRARTKVLRREKDQARAKIQRAEDDQAAVQEATLEVLQPRAPPKADEHNKTERDGLEETVNETPRVLAKAASYSNGRIPTSSLSRIFNESGPTVYLAAAPAAAWNTMALAAATRRDLATPQVNGSDSAYRTYDRQVYWRNYWCGRGQCGNAATPGYSNHGLAIAVDVPGGTQSLIRAIGNQFGWNHNCSDAPWEAWHHKWCGGFSRPDPGIDRANPILRRGSGGPGQARWVRLAQRRLAKHGEKVDPDGTYGLSTKQAVRRLQAEHKLKETGVIAKPTWVVLRRDP